MRKFVAWMAEKGCYDKREYIRYIFDDADEARIFIKSMIGILVCKDSYYTVDKNPRYYGD